MVQRVFTYFSQLSLLLNILYYHGVFVQTNELTLIHYYKLNSRFYSDLTSFSTKVFFSFLGFHLGCHVTFSHHVPLVSPGLWPFLSPSLFSMTLSVLKNVGQAFCRTPLNLGLSFSQDETGSLGFWVNALPVDLRFSPEEVASGRVSAAGEVTWWAKFRWGWGLKCLLAVMLACHASAIHLSRAISWLRWEATDRTSRSHLHSWAHQPTRECLSQRPDHSRPLILDKSHLQPVALIMTRPGGCLFLWRTTLWLPLLESMELHSQLAWFPWLKVLPLWIFLRRNQSLWNRRERGEIS